MARDPRIQPLLEQILDTGATPEEVCRDCPELLPGVWAGWRRLAAVQSQVGLLFPSSEFGPGDDRVSTVALDPGLPKIPGYELEEVLGQGGVGVVYRARHLRLNRTVALKMLLAGPFAQPVERDRFFREAEALAALRHPNIVQVHNCGEFDGRPFFTMEYVEGGTLSKKLAGTPQPAREAAELVAALADAVRIAHAGGIVHRDLKPLNVLLSADGTPKVTDFGLARRLEGDSGLTRTGAPLGTPSYMAPEQARGDKHTIGPAVDVYALGAILYECLTGRPPFHAETAAATLQQVLADEPVPPSRLNPRVPRDLDTICMKCLQKAPQHRYATASALADDLARYERGEPITARPVSRLERVTRWVRRKPTKAALILTALALIGLAVTGGVNKWRLEAKRRAEIAKWSPTLESVKRLLMAGRFEEARALLEGRPEVDVEELNNQIRADLAELNLAQKLGKIRLNQAAVVNGRYRVSTNRALSDREYEAAFAEAGIGGFQDASADVAPRIRDRPIAKVLVAALDDWAVCAKDKSRGTWILDVARRADPDPSGWRDRVRHPGLSREALTELAETAVVQEQSVQLLLALGLRIQAAGSDPIVYLKRVQSQYPGDFWANFTLAWALQDKFPEQSIRYYQAALAIRPETAVAHNYVGLGLTGADRVDAAIEYFREAIRLEPRYGYALANLGAALARKGQTEEGLELARRAVAVDDGNVATYTLLAEVLGIVGRTEEEIDVMRRCVALETNNPKGHFNLGNALYHLRRYDEAREQYEWARRLRPAAGLPYYGIGSALKEQGRVDEAIAEAEAGIRLEPQLYGLHWLLGNCWREKRAPQKALREYDKAIALQPSSTEIIQARRALLVKLGLGEEVRAEWEQTLKAGPAGHDAWYGYAELCLYLGHQDLYERACHDLLERFERNNDPRVRAQTGRACLLGHLGPEVTARAAALVERAVRSKLSPAEAGARPDYLVAQGLARYRQGDFEGAVNAIQGEALQAHGPLSQLVLSMAHRRARRTDEAYREFATAIQGYDWAPSRVDDSQEVWLYHVLRREAEPLVLPNLAALLAHQDEPRSPDERLALAAVCESRQMTARAAQLFVDAIALDPELLNRAKANQRYHAACCAARAGCGDGQDVANLSEPERRALRERARGWLRDDLAAMSRQLANESTIGRATVSERLESWFRDAALVGVRDDEALRKLPSVEREAWRALWRDAQSCLSDGRKTGKALGKVHP